MSDKNYTPVGASIPSEEWWRQAIMGRDNETCPTCVIERQRAETAERERDALKMEYDEYVRWTRDAIDKDGHSIAALRQRAERAEAVVAQIRRYAAKFCSTGGRFNCTCEGCSCEQLLMEYDAARAKADGSGK